MLSVRRPEFWLGLLVTLANASLASAQVNLTTVNPPAAQPGTVISMGGNGFPAGVIPVANVSVTITPPPGSGSPVTTAAANIVMGAGSNRTVVFALPAALTVSALTNCLVSVSGSTADNVPFSTATQASLTIQPPARVLSASPGAAQLGATGVTLSVVGAYTHFTSNSTVTLTLIETGPAPATTTINENALSTVLTDAEHLSATFNIPSGVPVGAYTVTVQTCQESANLPGGFLVSPSGPLSLSIVPNSLPAGQGAVVNVVGVNTHFVPGSTFASFGDGIEPGPVTVTDSTHASFAIGIDPITFTGSRTLIMETGGEFATGTFTITNNGASLTTVGTMLPSVCATACSGPQGTNATLLLTGSATHWIQAGTSVSVGGGINTGNITVTSPTALTVNISIGPGVLVGSYPVTVVTHGEVVALPSAFSVTPATPYLSNVSPNTGVQGQQDLNVTFTGVFTSFTTGAISANFGPNITVNSVTPNSPTSATANISIDYTAFTGGRSGTLTSNLTDFNFAFTVAPSAATLISATPNSGLQGASVALQVTGAYTHWADGLTFASLGDGIVVNRVIINAASAAEVDITIPTYASLGLTSLTMRTGGEIVTLNNAFTVLPYTPSLTMLPTSGMIPVAPVTSHTVNVNFIGNFTHFAVNQTIAAIDGNGVAIQNFTVLNKWNATAQFVIGQTAPASPALPCTNLYGGNRIVTLETPLATGSEIVHTGFCVTSTPAVLTSINPYHSAEPASSLTVSITGQYTHFETGVTTVGFGPNITVIPGSVNVTSPTTLTATIDIDASAVLGWRPVFVNTVDGANFINEQLTIGFALDPPATASLLSVVPGTGIQGQSLIVQITGNLTNWSQSNTLAIFGTGISVNTLTINSPASATAQLSIDAVNAPVGGSTVSMVTQLASGNEELVSGPLFSVTQGIAAIDHVGTSCTSTFTPTGTCAQHLLSLHQGDITPLFNVYGTNTHWLTGETTLDFGPDIAVSQLVVMSPTWIQCQIAVAYTATLGYRGVTAVTNAETAPSFSDALNVLAVQGLNVNITPTVGAQGTTFVIQVNGTNTHWTSSAANPVNNTTASFGNNDGVNVAAINVISPTQMNLTVQIAGTAYVGLYTLTISTTGLTVGPPPLSPQSTEQLIANNALAVGQGAGIITTVNPTGGPQNSTEQISVTGQNTSFLTGVTTAYLSAGGCIPPVPAGVNVSNVTASDNTHAVLAIAVSATAPTGYQTLCMYTLGESVSYGDAFEVLPGNPTLNQVAVTGPPPATGTSGQQGQTVNVSILGQYTHWGSASTVTFGQGITVSNLAITSATSLTATLTIEGWAYIGPRTTTVTTNNEIVSGNFFSVTQSDAIITTISPSSANQGQHILMTINGDFTHWSQELTQFSISGAGYDIKVNGVVINNPTQAVADLSILNVSGNAGLGTRTIFMSTVGENVSLQSGFLITGGVPSIVSISPDSGTRGDTADNVIITGQFTAWDSTTVVDFGDPAITVANTSTVNSNTSITAVINIGTGATLGVHTVTVRTGVSPNISVQLGQYTVYDPAAPPTPYIAYEYPSVALVGQTLAVNLGGAYTNWLPGQTTVSFGTGIQVNTVALQELDVTSTTTAVANITIVPGATLGPRTVTVTTGDQQLTTTFLVTVGTPAITFVSTNTASQGETRLLDLVGQYTTWTASGPTPTQFSFCPAITSVSSVQIFGPTAARVQVTVDPLGTLGSCPVVAITGAEVAGLGGGGSFSITPSAAVISSVTPNTAPQNATGVVVNVVGFATLWTPVTSFSFGSGVNVISQNVIDNTHATLTLSLDLYASPGTRSLTATTGGEVATLNNAFVVQPGTPILISATNATNQQQAQFSLGILGQSTNWTSTNTMVVFPNGGVVGAVVNVTSAQSITVTGTILATAYPGCGPIVVTTTGQVPPVLTLYGFCITPGPAAITQLSPNTLGQGQAANVAITGTNTNWVQGTTVGSFGPGISLNTLTIQTSTTATANVTVAANATPQANNVVLTTAGETAADISAFTIFAATPVVLDVFPNSATQGQTLDICVTSAFTHFVNGNTTADFGPGITVNSTTVAPTASCAQGDSTHADVNITITPTALTTPGNTNHVRMITNITSMPGAQEIAVWQNSSATQYNFGIARSGASISSATSLSPGAVHQNDTGDIITIVGAGTHFTAASPTIAFCAGVTTVGQTVVDDAHITATVNVSTGATVGPCGVTVTTGGEVASGTNLFNVLAGLPVLSQVSPSSTHQNDGQLTPVTVNITGLYTHFTSGGLGIVLPAGVTIVSGPTANSDTSLTAGIKIDPLAALGTFAVSVKDTIDVSVTLNNVFTIAAGVPTLVSMVPSTGAQGSSQTVTITGSYTSATWSGSSVVTVSGGSDVTVTGAPIIANLANGYQQTLQVTFDVTNGAAATARNVAVTSGGQQLSLANAFTVLPGVPNVSQISPNIGIPNSSVTVHLTGAFTAWVQGATTANFGSGISVNGFAEGAAGILTVDSPTTAHATLTIDANPAVSLGSWNVTVTTGTQVLTANNGFTVQTNTTTPPSVLYISPANGAGSAPINTKISVTFTEPLDPNTIASANAAFTDTGCYASASYPQAAGSPSLDVSGRVLTVIPVANLAVGHTYYVTLNSTSAPTGTKIISDQSGNHLAQNLCYSFTTGFAPDTSGPAFTMASVANGASGLPTNSKVILGFNKPINPATVPAGLAIQQGANPVPGTWGYSTDFTQAIFTPASNLTPSAPFTVTYDSMITDSVGTALSNPGILSFSTGTGTDTTGLTITSYTPVNGISTFGTNPTIRFEFNKPVNPLSFTPAVFYVYDTQNSAAVIGATTSFSPDNRTVTFNLAGPLLDATAYTVYMCSTYDWTTIYGICRSASFTTGPGLDSTAPFVTSVSPSPAPPFAPVNPTVYVRFSKLMDPTTAVNSAISLSPGPVTGTVSFYATDYSTLVFQPSVVLAANTTYTINVSGLMDQDGNAMTPFSSTFTTGAAATADTAHGTITGTPTGTNIPTNTQIVLQFSKPVDPLTLNAQSVDVWDNTASGSPHVPGTIAVDATETTATFTPASVFQGNHQICYYISSQAYAYDLAGNYFISNFTCFTTGAGTDTTAPIVTSVSPFTGATGIGPANPVIVTFSKSMNPSSLVGNVALYNGSTLVTSAYSPSSDYTTIVFSNGSLAFGTTFSIVVSPNVTDLAGNHLAAQYSSTFTTGAAPVTTRPSVTIMLPASGATGVPAPNPITLYFSTPMQNLNASSILISQNGTLISPSGSFNVQADNQAVTFTPGGGAFTSGALIEVWVTNPATDTSGNPVYAFSSHFNVQADLSTTPVTAANYYPCQYCSGIATNSVVEILLTKPLNPATFLPGNFYVTDSSGSPVGGSITLLNNGQLMRFALNPGTNFAANSLYYVHATTGLHDLSNLSYVGNSNYYFQTSALSNLAAPFVAATAPTNGATAIGVNAIIGVTFSASVDGNTLNATSVQLNGGAIPLTISYNSSKFAMTVTPDTPLPANSTVALTLNGVTDLEGNALSQTPYTLTFTTAAGPDYSVPVLVQQNVTSGQIEVPVNTSISLILSKPIDWRSVVPGNVYLYDPVLGNLSATLSPIGSNGILITPTQPFSVNRAIHVYASGISDLNGNISPGFVANFGFTTVLAALSGGPVLIQIVPANGSVNVPVNFKPMAQFDRPVNPESLSGITLMQGGSGVPATPILSAGGTVVTLVPNSILSPNLNYVFTVAGTQDSAGNSQASSVVTSFTTGASIDLTTPTVVSQTPINNSVTGENPIIELVFKKPLNPILSAGFTFYNITTGRSVNGSALAWSADFQSVRFTYPSALEPSSQYYWSMNVLTDLAGNTSGLGLVHFSTNAGIDATPETVASVTPFSGAGGVPLNAVVALRLSKPADPVSVNNSSVTLSPGVPGSSVQLSSDGMTITLTHPNLAPSTSYIISVLVGSFTDQNGNAVAAFSSGFTTGTSTDSASGSISLTNPASGTLGAALNQTITVTFSKPLDANSLSGQYFAVFENNNSNYPIAGAITNPTPNTLVFTPFVALPANATIYIYVGYYASIQDLAGNTFASLNNAWFGTANTVDNTPPQVVSINPANGATNVGPYAPVILTFNKSLDYTTITGNSFVLYNGAINLGATVSYSLDRRIVTLNTTLPYSANLTVAVSTNVKDYNGNNLANPCTAPLTSVCTFTFSTETPPISFNPSVIQARPTGSGAALTSPITLYTNSPMSLSSVQIGMFVAQNGALLVPSSITLTADQHGIVWTPPAVGFAPGALIEVDLYSPAADISGNLVNSYSYSFHTAAAPSLTAAPTETGYNPCKYCALNLADPVIEIQFSEPLDPATVTSATAFVKLNNAGTAVSGAPVLLNNNTLLRIPLAPTTLSLSNYYYVTLTNGLQDTNGNRFAGDNYYFFVASTAVNDITPPTVQAVTPTNLATGIGDNAPVRLVFSKVVDTLTIGPNTVSLLQGATALPYTITFSSINSGTQTTATLTPQAPLPDNSTITISLTGGLNGISDLAGNPLATQSTSFTTIAGADFSGPAVTELSVDSHNNAGVPVNSTFTIVFNKPLDPATVTSGGFDIYDYSIGSVTLQPINVSADGRTVTISPASNLAASHSMYYQWCGATDLNGNAAACGLQSFSTSSAVDITPPNVVSTNPLNGNTTTVPTNAVIEVSFNKAVRATSLSAITLTAGGNVPIRAVLNNAIYTDDTVVRLIPQALLLSDTVYTVSVSGVQDVAGNVMTGTYTFSFTTGPNFQTLGLVLPTVTVTTGAGPNTMPTSGTLPNVTDNPTFTIVFDHAVDYTAVLHSAITLRDTSNNLVSGVTLNYVLSTDQKTVTVTTSGLAAATTYHFALGWSAVYDSAGNQSVFGSQTYAFTTQ